VTRFAELLKALAAGQVGFVLVGGVAAAAHGSPRSTEDVDIVYGRGLDNLRRIVDSLAPHHPYLRGAPPGLPFRFDLETLRAGLNFTLTTDLGWIDLLGGIAGAGTFEGLLPHTIEVEVFGIACRVLDLETLIQAKKAAGRVKDLEDIAQLELLRERR
jgi:predicted nucleotidyltransferase